MPKIDVSRYVLEMEQVLHAQNDVVRCENAIAILLRWQFDEMRCWTMRRGRKRKRSCRNLPSCYAQMRGPAIEVCHGVEAEFSVIVERLRRDQRWEPDRRFLRRSLRVRPRKSVRRWRLATTNTINATVTARKVKRPGPTKKISKMLMP